MIEQDTIKLLRECDSGAKMGIEAINGVIEHVCDAFREELVKARNEHEEIEHGIRIELDSFGDEGKDPAIAAKAMSYIKTNVKIGIDPSDATAADLITDGCDMGVKSLSRYLNQYKAASESSKNTAKRLISSEENLARTARKYL